MAAVNLPFVQDGNRKTGKIMIHLDYRKKWGGELFSILSFFVRLMDIWTI